MTAVLTYHTKHVKALDGLRGYAAILVTFYQAIPHLEPTLVERVLSPSIDKFIVLIFWRKLSCAYLSHKYCEVYFINLERRMTKKYLPSKQP